MFGFLMILLVVAGAATAFLLPLRFAKLITLIWLLLSAVLLPFVYVPGLTERVGLSFEGYVVGAWAFSLMLFCCSAAVVIFRRGRARRTTNT